MQALKDADAKLDFSLDWSEWLGDDTITKSEWLLPTTTDGLAIDSSTNTTTITTVWLTGGVAVNRHKIINRITTAGGRIDDRPLFISVIER